MNRNQMDELVGTFQPVCVLGAAAELDLFSAIGSKKKTGALLAKELQCDERGMIMILDALTALKFLNKKGENYTVSPQHRQLLASQSPKNVLPSILHRMNVLRSWTELARVVKYGKPVCHQGSIRGPEGDKASFIGAMHTIAGPFADKVVRQIPKLKFKHLIDVGGASGTWALAFLRAHRGTKATIFDLPHAIEQARLRIRESGLFDRVTLVAGDFHVDELPHGADFAWVSAIIHMLSRKQNRELFQKIYAALEPGGLIGIRDVVMDGNRFRPVQGALFAINMLVNTEGGGTYTFAEIAEDLNAAGFISPKLVAKTPGMNSIVFARK